jgi:hypothetical protein
MREFNNILNDPFFQKPRSPEEIAEWINFPERSVWKAIKSGDLHAVKLSKKCVRCFPEDIIRWFENKATKSKPGTALEHA